MSHNWLMLCFAIGVQCLVFPLTNAGQADSCFSSSFSRAIGYILQGFLLGEIEVDSIIECKRRCVAIANCNSLNILSNSDGSFMCQLNSHLRESGLKEQFVRHASGEYYGLKEKKLCNDNGNTCSSVSSWFAFNQSSFQLVSNRLTFENARKVCQEMKGDLASTSSDEEQAFLYKIFLDSNPPAGSQVYVGLNDITKEGVFVWSDGSPNLYAKFRSGQPNNDGNEDCVTLEENFGDAVFNDRQCVEEKRFFCETSLVNL
ncbi:alpha-N-acetylgalactosamine-specific lectin-like [Dendronephthya gigantea]|uniref:alpha-N-acetylgalactosamine-specific lectin-like n=1 Tax=Dendronephthya gigantea TaxID=151771 RepID=UPI0010697B70|nr:alpha-N-acetylgalactosamine-specific lectin-like [Dendronephthya gigantea]